MMVHANTRRNAVPYLCQGLADFLSIYLVFSVSRDTDDVTPER